MEFLVPLALGAAMVLCVVSFLPPRFLRRYADWAEREFWTDPD